MNGRAARALRRDVRRSVGEEAIGIIDAQTNAINHQILPNLNSSQARLDELAGRTVVLEQHAHGCEDRLAELRQDIAEQMRRVETRLVIMETMATVHDDRIDTMQTVQRGLLPRGLSLSARLLWLVCGR